LERNLLLVTLRRHEIEVRDADAAERGVERFERLAQISLTDQQQFDIHANLLGLGRPVVEHRHEVNLVSRRERNRKTIREPETAREPVRVERPHTLVLALYRPLIAEQCMADV